MGAREPGQGGKAGRRAGLVLLVWRMRLAKCLQILHQSCEKSRELGCCQCSGSDRTTHPGGTRECESDERELLVAAIRQGVGWARKPGRRLEQIGWAAVVEAMVHLTFGVVLL